MVLFSFSQFYSGGKTKRKPSAFLEELFEPELLLPPQRDKNSLLEKDNKDTQLDNKEIDWNKLLPHYFSYTQLETFNLCPLQYKYSFVYRIPSPTTHPLTFGQTIHRTLKDFYEIIIKGIEVNKELLLEFYEKNWSREGFLSSEHVEQQYLKGKKILGDYYENNKENFGSPFYLEKEFVYKIAPEISLKGYFDRVDLFPDGTVEIIDYKTGEIKDLEKKKKEAKKSYQLSIYALAGKEVFGWNLDQTRLSLYYLEQNEKIFVVKNMKELIGVKEEIIQTVEKIKKSSFAPTKGYHCNFCAYRKICPLW